MHTHNKSINLHSHPHKQPLSMFLSHTQKINSSRLDLFGKGITNIDSKLHEFQYVKQVRELDLSHNAITKLDNIHEFQSVQVLNISHNHIVDGRQLEKLKKLKRLKTVLVKGNGFIKSKQGIDTALQILITLNTDIQILTTKQEELLRRVELKENAKAIKKHYLNMLNLHIEFVNEFNIQSLQITNKQFLSEHVFQPKITQLQYKHIIITKIIQNHNHQRVNKIQQILMLQEQKNNNNLIQLNRKIGEKQEILDNLKIKAKEKRKKEKVLKSNRNINKPTVSTEKKKYFHSPQRMAMTMTDTKYNEKNKEQYQHKKYHHYEEQENTIKQQEKFQTYYSNMLMKYNPVYHLLYSPLHSLKSSEKDLLISTLSHHLKEKCHKLYKLEKVKEQQGRLREQIKRKERDIDYGQKKFNEYKEMMSQRVQLLQGRNQECQQDNIGLKQKIQQLQEKYSILNNKYKYVDSKLNSTLQENQAYLQSNNTITKEEQLSQIISNRRHKTIKKMYVRMINHKCNHLNKLKRIQYYNHQQHHQSLYSLCFSALKYQYEFNKYQATYIQHQNQKKLSQSLQIFYQNTKYSHCRRKLNNLIINNNGKMLMSQLMENKREKQQQRLKTKESIQYYHSKQLKKYYRLWYEQIEKEKMQDKLNQAQEYHNKKILTKFYKYWQIYQKIPYVKEIQLYVKLKHLKYRQFMNKFTLNYDDGKLLRGKFMNLIIYQNQVNRLKKFHIFKKNTMENIQIFKNKQKRLWNFLRKREIFYLFHALSNQIHQKNIKKLKTNKLNTFIRKNNIVKLLNQENRRKNKRNALGELFKEINFKIIKLNMTQSLREFCLQDTIKKNRVTSFFNCLKHKNYQKKSIKYKVNQLKLTTLRKSEKNRNKSQFLKKMMKPMKNKKKLANYMANKYYNRMMRVFNSWKSLSYESQIEYYRQRIGEMGPEIQQISHRQKSTFEEKKVLMNIIEDKEKIIRKYLIQLQQTSLALKTKQEKFSQLKLYYKDVVEENTENRMLASFLSQSKAQRDYDSLMHQPFTKQESFSGFKPF